jgi:hypothetical protein
MIYIKNYVIESLPFSYTLWFNCFLNFILFPSFSFYVSNFISTFFHFNSNTVLVFGRFCQGALDTFVYW